MNKIYSISVLFAICLLFSGCTILSFKSDSRDTDYDKMNKKFKSVTFEGNNGGFKIQIPTVWIVGEEESSNDYSYFLQAGVGEHEASDFYVFAILKAKLSEKDLNCEIDQRVQQSLGRIANLILIRESSVLIQGIKRRLIHFGYVDSEGALIQEEIDVFIPVSDTEYYVFTAIKMNSNVIYKDFELMISIVKSFKIR
jgi:hypothetical protein